jgi:hypothetical protein
VLNHIGHGTFHVQPFVIVGIISSTREILGAGARLSLAEPAGEALCDSLLILSVNTGVVVALALALVFIRRLARIED